METPVYTNVYTDSRGVFGVVEYNSHGELRDVIRELKGVEFKNPFCEPCPVDLIDDTDDSKRDERSRDRERERSPGGARSPPRKTSPRSGTRSLSRSRSRCPLLPFPPATGLVSMCQVNATLCRQVQTATSCQLRVACLETVGVGYCVCC